MLISKEMQQKAKEKELCDHFWTFPLKVFDQLVQVLLELLFTNKGNKPVNRPKIKSP